MAWTNPAHAERLRDLRASGLSASQIATAINREFADASYSRNAVIGKVSRMGLGPIGGGRASAPARVSRPPVRQKAAAPTKPKGVMVLPPMKGGSWTEKAIAGRLATAEAKANPPEAIRQAAKRFEPLPGTEPVPFGSHGCRWPVQGEGADTMCCGAPRQDERPYCSDHWKVAHQPFKAGAARTGNELARQLRRWAARPAPGAVSPASSQ